MIHLQSQSNMAVAQLRGSSSVRSVGICSYLLLLLFIGPLVMAQGSFEVQWKGERLSVVAEQAPLSQVLQEVAGQTGIEFRGLNAPQERVSVNFSDVSLIEGLRILLADVDYVIIERTSSRGAVLPSRALILGRRIPSTSNATTDSELAQIGDERVSEGASLNPVGLPLPDEEIADLMSPDQGGTPLEDEELADLPSHDEGGVPLADEETADLPSPDQGGEPLEDEETPDAINPDQGGMPLQDEEAAEGATVVSGSSGS